jgi:hypothetical protein
MGLFCWRIVESGENAPAEERGDGRQKEERGEGERMSEGGKVRRRERRDVTTTTRKEEMFKQRQTGGTSDGGVANPARLSSCAHTVFSSSALANMRQPAAD